MKLSDVRNLVQIRKLDSSPHCNYFPLRTQQTALVHLSESEIVKWFCSKR